MTTLPAAFDNWIDLQEAAALLRIHPQSFRRLVKHQPYWRDRSEYFAGKYLFRREHVEQFKATYDPRPGNRGKRGRLL